MFANTITPLSGINNVTHIKGLSIFGPLIGKWNLNENKGLRHGAYNAVTIQLLASRVINLPDSVLMNPRT